MVLITIHNWIGHPAALLGSLVAILALSCGSPVSPPDFDNPIDPDSPDYVEPTLSITSGPAEGAVVNDHSVSFSWSGDALMEEYRFRITGQDWSPWDDITTATFTYLDEGDLRFTLAGRRASGEELSDSVGFFIDAITGPALRFYPRSVTVAPSGQFEVAVYAEEIDSLKGLRLVVAYDPTQLSLVTAEFDTTGFLSRSNGQILSFKNIDNLNGRVTFDAVLYAGDTRSISGTGPLARLVFRETTAQRGTLALTFGDLTSLRDDQNRTITLTAKVPGRVEVQ